MNRLNQMTSGSWSKSVSAYGMRQTSLSPSRAKDSKGSFTRRSTSSLLVFFNRLVHWQYLVKVSVISLVVVSLVSIVYLKSSPHRLRQHVGHNQRHRSKLKTQPSNVSKYYDVNQFHIVSESENSRVTLPLLTTVQHSVSATSSLNSTLLIQKQRQEHMRQACDALHLTPMSPKQLKIAVRASGVFYVDDRLRYIYCMVPKAACTTWTRVLLVASGQISRRNPNAISQEEARRYRVSGRILRPLARYSANDIQKRLKQYFKFMFVRHPLDRLSSAFKDRLKSDHKMPKQLYNRFIVDRYRDQNETKANSRRDVKFHEFVRFIVDPSNLPSHYNFHWRPQSDLCLPCHINYDFVGHQETLNADAEIVLARLGPRATRVQFPNFDPDNKQGSRQASATKSGHLTNWTAKLASKYAGVSEKDINRLRTVVYANDFDIFGYV